jgi:type IV pilus assembly protein PilV
VPSARAAGFSLIEVLVSMCVVSLGILALAALTQSATRHDAMNGLRVTATLLASDIADRLRANVAGARLGARGYDQASAAWPAPVAPPRAACTRARPCAPADLAQADLAAWTTRLRATLPSGSGWVTYHAATAQAGESADVWVGWRDPATLVAGGEGGGERAADECPAEWSAAAATVRCVYLQVGL